MTGKILIILTILAFIILGFYFLRLNTFTPSNSPKNEVVYQRNFPKVIAGNWEPSTEHMLKIIAEEKGNIKSLGVNTISVVPNYIFENGKPVLSAGKVGPVKVIGDPKQYHIDQIIKAKEVGFAVLLVPDVVGGDNIKVEGLNLEQFLEEAKKISLEWAQIAEKYQVEYFAPQNEFDYVLDFNFSHPNENNRQKYVDINNQWHKDVLPQIRERFKGKIIYKTASPDFRIEASGFDYIGIDFSQYSNNLEEFRKSVRGYYQKTSENAKTSGTGWLVGEFWVPYRERKGPTLGEVLRSKDGNVNYDESQDEIYRIATEEYLNFTGEVKPSGFIFIAYIMPSMDIKGRPAEQVLKNFFQKLLSNN